MKLYSDYGREFVCYQPMMVERVQEQVELGIEYVPVRWCCGCYNGKSKMLLRVYGDEFGNYWVCVTR